jgi:thiol-disulfide isomerase/thioredoxin
MKLKFVFFLLFLSIFSTINAQKSRVGETPEFSNNINLIAFNDSKNLDKESLTNINKPIAVFFWLSTCGPCIKELNALKKLPELEELKNKAIIMVVTDDQPKNYAAAKTIAKKYNWPYNMYFDKGFVLRRNLLLNWFGVPQVMVLDSNKKIVLHKFDYKTGDEKTIIAKLSALTDN